MTQQAKTNKKMKIKKQKNKITSRTKGYIIFISWFK